MIWPRLPIAFILLNLVPIAAVAEAGTGYLSRGQAEANAFAERYILQSATPNNLQWVPDPAGSGRTVMLAQVRDSDAKTFGGLRTEIVPAREYIREGVRWYAISVYFPVDWQAHPYPTIFAQLHTSQKKAILSPPVALVVHNRDIDLELYSNHRAVDGDNPATRSNSAFQRIRLGALQTARWYCFVMRANWSPKIGAGELAIWMNGEQVYQASNTINSYETWLGNYPKVGLYSPGMMGVKERHIFLDNIHTGGAHATLAQMAAKTPCASETREGAPK